MTMIIDGSTGLEFPDGTDQTTALPAPGTAGNVLQSNGSAWTSASNPPAFASGTKMLFVQTTAPTGWTKDTTNNDKALRVVSGTASTGGSASFSSVFTSQTPSGTVAVSVGAGTLGVNTSGLSAGATTLSTSQIPSHNHEDPMGSENLGLGWGYGVTSSSWRPGMNPNTYPRPLTSPTGGGGSHSHTVSGTATITGTPTGSGTFTGTAMNFAVQYVDVIIATKD